MQMAYGIPLPAVPFPYFYPSKPSLSSSASPCNSSSTRQTPEQKTTSSSASSSFKHHLNSPPLNYSKREVEIHQIPQSVSSSSSPTPPLPLANETRHSNKCEVIRGRSNHIDESTTDCDMVEENENVDIE